MTNALNCRFCGSQSLSTFVDLGMSPLSNSYLRAEQLSSQERFYPLHAYVCGKCFLVQLQQFETPERIFSDYAYFSSFADSWLKHAQDYVELVTRRFALDSGKHVIEIASNDGYLLQYFMKKGIPVLGIEPAANVAKVAIEKGIPSLVKFFGRQTAQALVHENRQADLLLGNNVLAHVPDLNDFVAGMKLTLKPQGVITMEFPHLMRLMEQNQFDTIYHEHFSYFSFLTVEKVFALHGLQIFDVEELTTHGGSLRIFAQHAQGPQEVSGRVPELRARETTGGFAEIALYHSFEKQVAAIKSDLLRFLAQSKEAGKKVVGYGAPAKGNTLLNYCGIRDDLLEYTVDRSPHKQSHFLPGTHIPVFAPEKIRQTKPDFVLILPWNLKDEIMGSMSFVRSWGGRFVVPIPQVRVLG